MGASTKPLRLVLFKSIANHQWYFHIKSANNKIIASSEGYKTKRAAVRTANLLCNMDIKIETSND